MGIIKRFTVKVSNDSRWKWGECRRVDWSFQTIHRPSFAALLIGLDVDKVDHEKLAHGVREKSRDNLGGVEQLLGLVVTNDDGAGAVDEEVIAILECPVTKTDGG